MKLVFASHGINEKLTNAGWVHSYKAQTYSRYDNIHVEIDRYKAGATPLRNHLFINPRQAKSLVVDVLNMLSVYPDSKLNFVAHSNGCNVQRKAFIALDKLGVKINNFVWVGGAVNSDVDRNSLLELHENGFYNHGYCYVSKGDIIRHLEFTPFFYGGLAGKGFRQDGKPFESDYLTTRWFETSTGKPFSHGEYYHHVNLETTIQQINLDLEINEPRTN